jgi:hypothetical protein
MASMLWEFVVPISLLFLTTRLILALPKDRREDPKIRLLNSLMTAADDSATPSGTPLLAARPGDDPNCVAGPRDSRDAR